MPISSRESSSMTIITPSLSWSALLSTPSTRLPSSRIDCSAMIPAVGRVQASTGTQSAAARQGCGANIGRLMRNEPLRNLVDQQAGY